MSYIVLFSKCVIIFRGLFTCVSYSQQHLKSKLEFYFSSDNTDWKDTLQQLFVSDKKKLKVTKQTVVQTQLHTNTQNGFLSKS